MTKMTSRRRDHNDAEKNEEDELSHRYPSWHTTAAGGCAGFGSRMVTAPLDLIRIRRQLNLADPSLWHTMQEIYHTEGGLVALYRGNMAAILLWMGYSAVQFSVYHQVKAALPDQHSQNWHSFVAGGMAGLCALLVTYPLDVCRTSLVADGIRSRIVSTSSLGDPLPLQTRYTSTTTMTSFARQLYANKGLSGFYAGVGPAMVQIVPYMGINFTIYEWLTQQPSSTSTTTTSSNSVGLAAYAGSISGAISKTVVYPLDTVKRRLQALATTTTADHRSSSMTQCLTQIVREEGWGALYRGWVPSVVKTAAATATAFALYRGSKNMLESVYDTATAKESS